MTDTCLFCRIIRGEIPATIVFDNEQVVAIRDIDPKAPTHVLVIPRVHIATLDDARDATLLGGMMLAAAEIARAEGLVESGYRTVVNCGANAGQSVFHIHLHLLGGRALSWPPG